MTVATASNRSDYTGNAVATSFAYPGKIFAATDLQVYVAGVLQVLNTDYTVTNVNSIDGGNVVFTTAPADLAAIVILRIVDETQATSLRNQGAYYADSVEDALDRRAMVDIQLQDQLDGAIKQPITEDRLNMSLPVAVTRATKYLAFDSNGLPIALALAASPPVLAAVDSIAALRLLSGTTDGEQIFLNNYYAGIAGGGGNFYWDAASVAADNGGTIIAPTGVSTGRWYRIYSGEINVKWFGAKGDNATDDSSAIQYALDALSEDGTLDFPASAAYVCASGLSIGNYTVRLRGVAGSWVGTPDGFSPMLKFTGSGTFITAHAVTIEALNIQGPLNGLNIFTVGTIGLQTSGNVVLLDTTFQNWETCWKRTGAYYSKMFRGQMQNCSIGFAGADLNNMLFDGVRFCTANNFVTISGGVGPITFVGCSFEQWTNSFITSSGGAPASKVNFIGCYIENAPTTTVAPGLTSKDSVNNTYNLSYGILLSASSVNIEGCSGYLDGISRLVYSSSGTMPLLRSVGNDWFLVDATYKPDTVFYGAANQIDLRDVYRNSMTGVSQGNVGLLASPGMYSDFSNVLVINPPAKTVATLLNGYVAATNYDAPYYWKDAFGEVHLGGAVNGSASTSAIVFTLPAGFVPSGAAYRSFPIYQSNAAGAVGWCRVQSTGDVRIDTAGGHADTIISLSGITFRAN